MFEEEIFKRSIPDYKKLIDYGFIKEKVLEFYEVININTAETL